MKSIGTASGVPGSLNVGKINTDYVKHAFVVNGFTALKFMKAPQNQYNFFQGVPACVSKNACVEYFRSLLRNPPAMEKAPWHEKLYF